MGKLKRSVSLGLIAFQLCMVQTYGKDDGQALRNYQATKKLYSELIAENTPNAKPQLAELGMLINMMPKGGDLHHHYSGALYAETYLDWIGRKGYCIYYTDDPANHREKFRIDTSRPGATTADCLSADAVRANDTFYRQLLTHWSDKDFDNHYHEQLPPDQQFFDTFAFFSPATKDTVKEGLLLLKQRAKADQVQYLETMLKSAPVVESTDSCECSEQQFDATLNHADESSIDATLNIYADALEHDAALQKRIADYRAELASYATGLDDADFTLRFQTYAARNAAPAVVFSGLYSAFSATHDNQLIVGVNIVGPENGYVAMRDYRLHMQMFHFLKQRFPDVHLALHAGELTLGMVPPEGLHDHMREAVDIAGAERIGHGVDITYESAPDRLLESLRRHDVAVEVCLSSNAFILGVKDEAHPVTLYLRHHVPFVIATDDAGVSRSSMEEEYILFVSRYKPSYDSLKQVVYNSIRYSFLGAEEKKAQIRQLDRRFAQFEDEVEKLADAKIAEAR